MVMKQQFNNMAVKEELIKALIIQYDESIRLQSKLLDCGFAEALLNVIPINMKNREALTAQLDKRTNECERLKIYLEAARDKVSKLFAKHEENAHLKEFLDFAFSLSIFCDSDEDIDDESNSEAGNLLQFYGYDISLKDKISEESNRNNNASSEHESEGVGLQLYEMIVNLMSKLSIGNERNPDVSDEISSKCIQKPTSTPAELPNSMTTSSKPQKIILHEREHMKKIQSFHCTKCGKSFPMKKNKEKLVRCPICDKHASKNSDEEKITIPIVALEEDRNGKSQKVGDFSGKSQSGISSLSCDTCGKTYSNKKAREKHIRQVHEKPYECTECGKRFGQKGTLKIHTAAHDGKSQKIDDFSKRSQSQISSFRCDICSIKFPNKITFGKHLRQAHRAEKPFECTECGERFARNINLKEHSQVHGLQRPFKCSVCNVGFKYVGDKNRHEQMVHEGGLQCAHCDRRYRIKQSLLSHIHTKHFPKSLQFKCTICNKAFALKHHLTSHKLTHSSQKSFKCSICDRCFKFDSGRLYHEKTVHGKGVRFPCEYCFRGYWNEASLIRHLRENHNK